MNAKESFDKAISNIKRENIDQLVSWLTNESDFFTAPASTNYHSNYENGLLIHSIAVTRFALYNFNLIVKEKPDLEYLRESVVICGLFHDVCKTNFYIKETKWKKDSSNKWQSYEGWNIKDKFPMPHGSKSVYLISKYVKLTDAEALAITWHMGESDLSPQGSSSRYAYQQAWEHPLVKIIMAADILATSIEETIDYKNII